MEHLHSVIDYDKRFCIDPVTRMVKNNSGKVTLAQHDHNSERFTFEIPHADGHDMSSCDRVEIHFINKSNSSTSLRSEGVYLVDDVKVSPEDNETVTFSWLISDEATKYAGSLKFLVRFICLSGEKIAYSWSTAIFKGITVVAGM